MTSGKLAVLWDVDGTLADSEPLHRRAALMTLGSFGIQGKEEDELLGVNRELVYQHLCTVYAGMPSYSAYAASVDEFFLAELHTIKPMGIAVDVCRKYHLQGRRQAAVSNSEPDLVHGMLEALGIADHFSCVITCDGKSKPKPHPHPYERAMEQLGVGPDAAIAIEDSHVGCTSARAAGLFVVGVPEDGADIGAHVHLDSMPDLDPEQIMAKHG